jgi:hypothetical protein
MTQIDHPRTLAEDVLARAAEDWIYEAEVIDLVRQSGLEDPATLRDLAVGLICRLIVEGMLVPGDVGEEGHAPWQISQGEALERLTRQWAMKADPFVMPGTIVWLATTPDGQAVGEAIWHREANN